MHEELKARLLAWTKTSSSFGLDSIGKDIAKALEAIEQLERQLADRDAEIAKYRDAPVVAYMHPHGGLLHKPSTGLERETYTINLIVKPGERR